MDELSTILSYVNKLSRESREWEAIGSSVRDLVLYARTIYMVHERAGIPLPPGVPEVLDRLREAVRSGDLPATAAIVCENIYHMRRAATLYLTLYRLTSLLLLAPGLGGVFVSTYLAFTAPTAVITLLSLTAAGLLASTFISPVKYSAYPILASALILALAYAQAPPGSVSGSILLYSAVLASSVIAAGALKGGIGLNSSGVA